MNKKCWVCRGWVCWIKQRLKPCARPRTSKTIWIAWTICQMTYKDVCHRWENWTVWAQVCTNSVRAKATSEYLLFHKLVMEANSGKIHLSLWKRMRGSCGTCSVPITNLDHNRDRPRLTFGMIFDQTSIVESAVPSWSEYSDSYDSHFCCV